MIDSNNIEIIRDNLKELDQKIENLDVEIPSHTSGDAGKYLGVDSSGDLEFSLPIPATTGADEGKVLTVNSSGVPAFVTPLPGNLDYSTTEQDTGVKWIDGKPIYSKTFEIPEDEETPSTVVKTISLLELSIDKVIYFKGITCRKDNDGLIIYDLSDNYSANDHSQFRIVKKANVDANYALTFSTGKFGGGNFTLFYTKVTPEPSPETLTKKKKSK